MHVSFATNIMLNSIIRAQQYSPVNQVIGQKVEQ